jgi:hypothetical protein
MHAHQRADAQSFTLLELVGLFISAQKLLFVAELVCGRDVRRVSGAVPHFAGRTDLGVPPALSEVPRRMTCRSHCRWARVHMTLPGMRVWPQTLQRERLQQHLLRLQQQQQPSSVRAFPPSPALELAPELSRWPASARCRLQVRPRHHRQCSSHSSRPAGLPLAPGAQAPRRAPHRPWAPSRGTRASRQPLLRSSALPCSRTCKGPSETRRWAPTAGPPGRAALRTTRTRRRGDPAAATPAPSVQAGSQRRPPTTHRRPSEPRDARVGFDAVHVLSRHAERRTRRHASDDSTG